MRFLVLKNFYIHFYRFPTLGGERRRIERMMRMCFIVFLIGLEEPYIYKFRGFYKNREGCGKEIYKKMGVK